MKEQQKVYSFQSHQTKQQEMGYQVRTMMEHQWVTDFDQEIGPAPRTGPIWVTKPLLLTGIVLVIGPAPRIGLVQATEPR